MLNRRANFFRTFITSHRVGTLAIKHQVLRIQVNKSKSWCYWVGDNLTTKTGHWAASVFAIRLLTKTLSARGAGLLSSSSRPPGKLWYIGCFCCCALFLAKSNRSAAETEKQNLEGQKAGMKPRTAPKHWTGGRQAAGDCCLEKGRMLLEPWRKVNDVERGGCIYW